MGVSSSRLGPAFAVLFAGASVVPAGCAHTVAPASTTPAPTEVDARVQELTQRNAELEEQVRQLRGQLALAQAEARDLRSGVGAPNAVSSTRETVRIGGGEVRPNDEGYVEPPLDAEPVARGSSRTGGAERPTQGSQSGRDERPVLRLYGSPALPLDGAGYITVRERLPPGPDVRPLPPSAQPAPAAVVPAGVAATPPTVPSPTDPTPPQGAAPAASASRTAASARTSEDDPAQQSYRAALALVTARRFAEANEALTRFLQQYPDHPYTDNALYWRGTVAYAERRYADALRDFERVVAEFPRGNKVPDALYQIGMCHLRMGDRDTARSYFRRVQAEYPNTVAARLAAREDAS